MTLRLEGTKVSVSGDAPLAARIAGGLARLGAEIGSEAAAVVHVADFGLLEELPFAETSEAAWVAGAEDPIWGALVAFQRAYATGAKAIVAVVPFVALTGAAGIAPQAAGAEGIRQLVKSAARAWGREGVRVNCVTLPVEAWGFEPSPDHRVPNRYGPSLLDGTTPDEIAAAIGLLLDAGAAAVTGATVGVDGGTVLAP